MPQISVRGLEMPESPIRKLAPLAAAAKKKGTKVGVSMPTKDLQRWNQDGANMKAQLEKAGYVVDLQYANNDIATQVSQIENMITGKCNVLVVASIDGSALKNALDGAKKKRIPVIAYDRLIMNTNSVSYYATFDNYKVGTIQGEYLVDKLNLKNRTKSDPAYIEFFTGSPDDNNINFFFGGAMDTLKHYLDSGVLVCRSGQTSKAQCATLNWSTEEGQKRMENLITSNGYGPRGTKLDAVYSSNDSVAMGITNALVAAGYTKANFPIVTGQDCDIGSVKTCSRELRQCLFSRTHALWQKKLLEWLTHFFREQNQKSTTQRLMTMEKELFLHTFVIQFMLMFQTTRLSLLILDITQKLSLNSKN